MQFIEIDKLPKQQIRKKKGERGQSLIELSLTLVFVLLLLAGLVDLSRAFFTLMALREAAQEGAVFGALHPSDLEGIEKRVRTTSQQPVNLLDLSDENVVISIATNEACASLDSYNSITVTVNYNNFTLITPFLGAILGAQNIPLSTRSSDTILRPLCPYESFE